MSSAFVRRVLTAKQKKMYMNTKEMNLVRMIKKNGVKLTSAN